MNRVTLSWPTSVMLHNLLKRNQRETARSAPFAGWPQSSSEERALTISRLTFGPSVSSLLSWLMVSLPTFPSLSRKSCTSSLQRMHRPYKMPSGARHSAISWVAVSTRTRREGLMRKSSFSMNFCAMLKSTERSSSSSSSSGRRRTAYRSNSFD